MLKTLKAIVGAAIVAVMLTGCYERVPPGHKGKILGPSGYSPELLSEGRHWEGWREDLVLLDLTTTKASMPMEVTMKDYDSEGNVRAGLGMNFELSFRYRLRDDASIINTMFSDIKVDPSVGVTAHMVYNVYADALVQTAFRDVMSQFTPEEALANRAHINVMVSEEVQKQLKGSPIEVSNTVVTRMTLPETIKKRIKTNKDRELQLAEEEAQQAIELAKRVNSIVLARKDAERNLIDAQAASEQNRELQKGLNAEVLRLRELELQKIYAEAFAKRFANSSEGDTVFMPYEALTSTGSQVRMFQK